MNDWDPRRSTDDDYIDPEDTATATTHDTTPSPAVHVPPTPPVGEATPPSPVAAPSPPPAVVTSPGLIAAPSNDELFTAATEPDPVSIPGPAYIPPSNDALFRRPPRRTPATEPEPAPAPPSVGATADTGAPARDRKTAKITVVLAGVIVLAGAGGIFWAANALRGGDSTNLADDFPAPTTTTEAAAAAPETTPALPPFCVDPNPADNAVVTNAVGDRNSGIGVITAFEYHYYADRDARKVAATYDPALQMDPAGIQPFIDAIAPGTKHCMTITPTGKPDEFRVAGELRSPNSARTAPVDPLIITTAPSPGGWMITAVASPPAP